MKLRICIGCLAAAFAFTTAPVTFAQSERGLEKGQGKGLTKERKNEKENPSDPKAGTVGQSATGGTGTATSSGTVVLARPAALAPAVMRRARPLAAQRLAVIRPAVRFSSADKAKIMPKSTINANTTGGNTTGGATTGGSATGGAGTGGTATGTGGSGTSGTAAAPAPAAPRPRRSKPVTKHSTARGVPRGRLCFHSI
jgi:hypothetical protein